MCGETGGGRCPVSVAAAAPKGLASALAKGHRWTVSDRTPQIVFRQDTKMHFFQLQQATMRIRKIPIIFKHQKHHQNTPKHNTG